MNKIVTVVIPVWNREGLIERTLDSFAVQDCSMFSFIIVDNNSTDRSVAVVSEWIETHPEIDIKIMSERKHGATAARNTGLKAVSTPYVMFFDSDDISLPGHLDKIVARVSSAPPVDILGWDIDMELKSGRRRLCRFHSENAMLNHLVHATLATQRFLASTALVRSVGAWNESLPGWNDYELGVRLLLSARTIEKLHANEQVVRTYFTENSITGRSFSSNPGKWEKSLDAIESVLYAKRPEALCWLSYRRAILAAEYKREGSVDDARRLLEKADGRYSGRLPVRLIYWFHRIFHRGSWIIASTFLPKKI